MKREDLADLFAFKLIAEEKSFTRAAVRLGISSSALSHAIRLLEERLGTKLLNRTTRSVAPTAAGQKLLNRLAPAFVDIAESIDSLAEERDTPSGIVKINAHRTAAFLYVLPRLLTLRQAHPGIIIDLTVDDRLIDIVEGGFDAGIRYGEQLAKDMVAVRIGREGSIAVVASPEYLATRSAILKPADLLLHDCLIWNSHTHGEWRRWDFMREHRKISVDVNPVFISSDISILIASALKGCGLTYVLREQVKDHLESGRLVEMLSDYSMPHDACFLYYPDRKQMRPAMRTVIDCLKDRAPNL